MTEQHQISQLYKIGVLDSVTEHRIATIQPQQINLFAMNPNKQNHKEATVLEHIPRYYRSRVKMKKKGKKTYKLNMKTIRSTRKFPEITGTEGVRNKNKLEMKLLRIEGRKGIY